MPKHKEGHDSFFLFLYSVQRDVKRAIRTTMSLTDDTIDSRRIICWTQRLEAVARFVNRRKSVE